MYSVLPLIVLADWILNMLINIVIGIVGLLTIPFVLFLDDFPN